MTNRLGVVALLCCYLAGNGLCGPDPFESSRWIKAPFGDGEPTCPRFVKAWTAKAGVRRLVICGLGAYVAYLNKKKVGGERDVLTPHWTDTRKTVVYDEYDVELSDGTNTLEVILAGGMYDVPRTPGRYQKFVGSLGPKMLIVGGCVRSDETWRVGPSAVTFSTVYGGDDVDGRLEEALPRGSVAVVPCSGPMGRMTPSTFRIRTFRDRKGRKIAEKDGRWATYDFGENLASIPTVVVRGDRGAQVKLRFAERILKDGSLDPYCAGKYVDKTSCTYTLKGAPEGERFTPPFFYWGYQFSCVELIPVEEGASVPEVLDIEAREVHADVPAVGGFECSDNMLNRIRRLVTNSQRSNLQSVFTDCPHREKLGWLEQNGLHSRQFRWEYDASKVFEKCCQDMADAQCEDGLVPSIAPEYVKFPGGFRDAIEYGGSVVLIPWQQWQWTGDDSLIARHYPNMAKYMDYCHGKSRNWIKDGGLGDWDGSRSALDLDKRVSATCVWYLHCDAMVKMSARLGMSGEAKKYRDWQDHIAEAFEREFWNDASNCVCGGEQGAQAMAVGTGVLRDPVKRRAATSCLVNDIVGRGNTVTAGEIAYPFLLKVLMEEGCDELIHAMTVNTEKPGYGYMVRKGYTSLHESWDCHPNLSCNHFMFGDIIEWFYEGLAGIRQTSPRFHTFDVSPRYPSKISWVKASHQVPDGGAIQVEWKREEQGGGVALTVCVPEACRARVDLGAEVIDQDAGRHMYHVSEPGKRFRADAAR